MLANQYKQIDEYMNESFKHAVNTITGDCSKPNPDYRTPVDWDAPLEAVRPHDGRIFKDVRFLARGIVSKKCPGKTVLVSVVSWAGGADILCYVDPVTGDACTVRQCLPFKIRNVQKPKEATVYFQGYYNPGKNATVWSEFFDSPPEAKNNSYFCAPDFTVEVKATQCCEGAPWVASAKVV